MAAAEAGVVTPARIWVDLAGTLIRSDLLLEALVLLIKRNPLILLRLPLWLLRGREIFGAEIAARVTLDPAALPYNKAFVSWLEAERRAGRSLWLYSAADEPLARRVAEHLGLFDGVLAGDPGTALLAGSNKADFPDRRNTLRATLRALRPHQWAKNVLILIPILAAHEATDLPLLGTALLALVAFCLCASSVYLLNDLLDLEADRTHPSKSKRPFAAGDLSILAGLVLAPALLITGALLAAFLPEKFQLVFASYYVLTLAYSFFLKGWVLLDALTLAGLYTLRIIAGAAAVNVPLSFWLLLFSVFLFLSLAFVKRFAELEGLRRQQRLRAAGRGYCVDDLPMLQSLGSASGYLSVLVLALYINSPEIQALYRQPKAIWFLCVLMLYWVSRVWMQAARGLMHDDPVVFALKDRVSLGIGILAVLTVFVAAL
jgi:4-hydroxybenzoate polyprenyltransferase